MVDFIGSELFEFHGLSDLCGVRFVWALLKVVCRCKHRGHKDGETEQRSCNAGKGFMEFHGRLSLCIHHLSMTPVATSPN